MPEETDNENTNDTNCIFCSIAQKKSAAEIVYESDNAIFFHSISPQSAVHIIGIPKKHITSIEKISEENQVQMGLLLHEVGIVANKLGLSEDGYRVITNIGNNAGQEIKHFHWHMLGGEKLGPLKTGGV